MRGRIVLMPGWHAEGLARRSGSGRWPCAAGYCAAVVTAASAVDTAVAAAVALGWLPMFFSVSAA